MIRPALAVLLLATLTVLGLRFLCSDIETARTEIQRLDEEYEDMNMAFEHHRLRMERDGELYPVTCR